MTTKELFLERERNTLSAHAFLTENTKGRQMPIPPCPHRTDFQRDRDRITHSTAFRRLMHKTQVFFAPKDEHYRTRMTHTFEVTQIARGIARALMLNEDLTEAIALGHDLGHTPFGHEGERSMRECYDPNFAHYEQSLRVVDILEKDGKGLNLTAEVRDGILNHQGDHMASTLEGVIVKYADRIAYINHDIDDAVRAKILSVNDLPKEANDILGTEYGARVNNMVAAVIEASLGKDYIAMLPDQNRAMHLLRNYLTENMYNNSPAKTEEGRASSLIIGLYNYFVKHKDKLPRFYRQRLHIDPVERCVCDYISSMTDRYAIELYEALFIPKVWGGA